MSVTKYLKETTLNLFNSSLGPDPYKRKPPLMITPSQIKTTIRPNTFTAQDASIYSNAELDQF